MFLMDVCDLGFWKFYLVYVREGIFVRGMFRRIYLGWGLLGWVEFWRGLFGDLN